EFQSLRARPDLLRRLAEDAGGATSTVAEAADLPERIENADRVLKARGPDEPLWDNGWTLALLAVLLGLEWTLRRRHYLL
ncbi:MAG: hypothetical protein D6744_10190, partial [Planctomycetota bacterium]